MYARFYGLTDKPFQLTADPRLVYPSKTHQRAISYLRYGLSQAEGFIVITGDIGTGKTTLVKNLIGEIDSTKYTAAVLVTTQIDDFDLLKMVSAAFNVENKGLAKGDLLQKIHEFLLKEQRSNRRVLLIIDEAQNLPIRTIEELRMLSNYEVDGKPVLQCFLLGQKEFRITLCSPQLKQLRDRVIASSYLEPLSAKEVKNYTVHRLKCCGWRNNPSIDEACYEQAYKFTQGVPRRINLYWDRVFLYAFMEKSNSIDSELLAAVELELNDEKYDHQEMILSSKKEEENIYEQLRDVNSILGEFASSLKQAADNLTERVDGKPH